MLGSLKSKQSQQKLKYDIISGSKIGQEKLGGYARMRVRTCMCTRLIVFSSFILRSSNLSRRMFKLLLEEINGKKGKGEKRKLQIRTYCNFVHLGT